MNKFKVTLTAILLASLFVFSNQLVTDAASNQLLSSIPEPSSESLRINKLARKYVSLHNFRFSLDKAAKSNLSRNDFTVAKKLIGQSNAVLQKAQTKINAKQWIYKVHPNKKFVSLATYKSSAQRQKMRSQYSYTRNYKIVTPFYITKSVVIQYNDQKMDQRLKVLSQALKQIKLKNWRYYIPKKQLAQYSGFNQRLIGKLISSDNRQIKSVLKLASKGDAKVWKNKANTRVRYRYSEDYWKKFVNLHFAANLRKKGAQSRATNNDDLNY
ncbi:hypothetical protein [Lentilactobacillus kosonis]|uniref:Uncharacterized protein n=1 Tax=Lentilactobacillus kosonis TaxID=2810561 RepID=A0A401FNH5_9LACO|nr:hypothetical protein [Lentilactobacillus kosonis]GAY73939.1 hypothetical protein NBRC111893_2085 [Lentilactobacillus kosonis]